LLNVGFDRRNRYSVLVRQVTLFWIDCAIPVLDPNINVANRCSEQVDSTDTNLAAAISYMESYEKFAIKEGAVRRLHPSVNPTGTVSKARNRRVTVRVLPPCNRDD